MFDYVFACFFLFDYVFTMCTICFLQEIMLGKSKVVLTGGVDNMSMAPYAARDIRFGPKIGVDFKLEVFFLCDYLKS